MLHDMKLMLKVTFKFNSDSTVTIASNTSKSDSDVRWKFTVNSEKKTMLILEESRTIDYHYTIENNKLTLKDKEGRIEFEKVKP